MISMQYIHRGNRTVERQTFSPPIFQSRVFEGRKQVGKKNTSSPKKMYQKPSFPQMVYQILEDSQKVGTESIVAWEDNGTSFHIYQPDLFNNIILPKYSRKKTKFRSFQRQLNIYGFRMNKSGVYRHALFRRGYLHSILRIRPSTTLKKKKNDRDDNDDETKSSSSSNVQGTPSDDEGVNDVLNTPPIVPLSRNITLEMLESDDDRKKANETDDKKDSFVSSDKDTAVCIQSSTGIRAASLGQANKTFATIRGDFEFDLFDDMGGIDLCRCNGYGCCFTEN